MQGKRTMTRLERVFPGEHESSPAPERLPVQTCVLAIASMSLALWLAVGLALRLSL